MSTLFSMFNADNDSSDKGTGVSCYVANCMYNKNANICRADQINVQCVYDDATSSADTECKTFKQKDDGSWID